MLSRIALRGLNLDVGMMSTERSVISASTSTGGNLQKLLKTKAAIEAAAAVAERSSNFASLEIDFNHLNLFWSYKIFNLETEK